MRTRFAAAVLLLAAAAWAQSPGPVIEGWYRGEPILFRDLDGQALVEGDMLLGPTASLLSPASAKAAPRETGVIAGDRFRWTNRVIPYEIDPAIPSPDRVTRAIEVWNDHTIIRLVPRDDEANYVRFVRVASGCSANVGMLGGRQIVNLADGCSLGSVVHEIGHAVGLHHTQGRNDRGTRLRVLPENVNPSDRGAYDQVILSREDIGPYDYGAIMHYSDQGFTVSARGAFETVPPGIAAGQRTALSASEIQAVALLYGEPVRDVLVDTVPTGLPVTVDGETVIAPHRFAWSPGQRHRIAAPALASTGAANLERRFARWSDGGAAEHEVTVTDSSRSFVASYATYHCLRTGAQPAGAGEVSVWPPSPDGFYPSGALLRIAAAPAPGWRFFGWEAGAGGFTYLALNLQGNGANPVEYNIRASDAFYVARFTQADFTVIASNPPGAAIQVDGVTVYTPRHVAWAAGSQHRLSVAESQSPASSTFSRLRFVAWSNGGERTQTVIAPPAPDTITLDLARQFRVQVSNVSTRTAGVQAPVAVRIDPPGDAGWYDAGSTVQLDAPTLRNLRFINWTGDLSGSVNPLTITVDAPVFASANFQSPGVLGVSGIVNDASRQPRTLSPGALTTILLAGPEIPAAGVAVEVAGKAARVVHAELGAVAFVCPADIPLHVPVAVRLQPLNVSATIPSVHASPGIYTVDGSGSGPAISEGDSARGGAVRLLVTGLDPAAPSAVRVFVDGFQAELLGVTPADLGRYWVALRVPDLAASGAVRVTVETAGARSQLGATLTIP